MTKFLVVASGKGGVGKTTVSINLANALSGFGKDVTVVDADLFNPNVSLYLGHEKVDATLHNVLKGERRIHDSIYLHPSGIKVIPSSISLSDVNHSNYENLAKILSDLSGYTDIVIIDSHPGINNDAQALFHLADEVLVVTVPELTAVTDAMKTIRMAEALGSTVIGVLLNRVEGKNYEMKTEEIESFLEKPIIATIPEDKNIKKSALENHPVCYLYPKSSASVGFNKLAANLVGEEISQGDGFFKDIMKIFGLTK